MVDPKESVPESTHIFYEQWCQDIRDLNQIFWRVPFIAMTMTGGIVFAVGTFNFSPGWQAAILYFLALCNLCFVVIIWRLRVGVMEPILRRIHEYEGRRKPPMNYVVMITFTILFLCVATFAVYGAHNRDLILTPSLPGDDETRPTPDC